MPSSIPILKRPLLDFETRGHQSGTHSEYLPSKSLFELHQQKSSIFLLRHSNILILLILGDELKYPPLNIVDQY